MPELEFLPWDSEFFGRRVQRTDGDILSERDIRHIDRQAVLSGTSLLYHFQSAEHIALCSLLCENGFRFIQQQAVFISQKDAGARDAAGGRSGVSVFRQGVDRPESLYGIALEVGRHSRFALEPSVGAEKTDELYRRWVDNSCSGALADLVLVARSGSEVRGFCTVKSKNGCMTIGLIGVSEKARRAGVGTALMLAARREASRRGQYISVTTQTNNIAAMNFYARCGLALSQVQCVFHKEYRAPAGR